MDTATHRTHSLYWQGTYRQLAFMRDDWFELLITAFDKIIVRDHAVLVEALGSSVKILEGRHWGEVSQLRWFLSNR